MIQLPARIIVSGSSYSGKTTFVRQLIDNWYAFTGTIPRVIWCYAERNSLPDNLPEGTITYQGVPNAEDLHFWINTYTTNSGSSSSSASTISKPMQHVILVLDDLQTVVSKSEEVGTCFTTLSHHLNFTPIYITQNLFKQGSHQREITLNASMIVLMRNVRDKSQMFFLARQLNPHRPSALYNAYMDATSLPYSHFVIDLSQTTPDYGRYISNLFDLAPTSFVLGDGGTMSDILY